MKLGNGVTAIVTGGASGLGAASAAMLANAGCKVAIFDANREAGEKLREVHRRTFLLLRRNERNYGLHCIGMGAGRTRSRTHPCKLRGRCHRKKTLSRDKQTGEIIAHSLSAFEKVLAVNLAGTFHMISRCAASMAKLDPITVDGERGVIVCTSSIAAQDGQMGQAAYAASKGGVAAITLPIARELAREGIRVNTILPGLFSTPMFAGLPEEARRSLETMTPFPARLGDPSEYAALVKHICENEMMNGALIRLNGDPSYGPTVNNRL